MTKKEQSFKLELFNLINLYLTRENDGSKHAAMTKKPIKIA
jgi:hypothetical protein